MSKTDEIEHALRMLNEAYAKGRITEADYERQDARLRARQADIRAWREGQGSEAPTGLRGGCSRAPGCQGPAKAKTPPGAVPGPAQGHLAFPRRPIRFDLPVRLVRRRGLAYGGMLPPAIAKTFTVGQAAVLSVVAWEHLHHGACRKSYAEIADEAGCSRRWVKATIGLARTSGIISVHHRPRPGRKDDTNVIRIVDADWLAWIKTRAERIEAGRRAAAKGIGGSRVPTSPNNSRFKSSFETRERPIEAPDGNERGCRRAGRAGGGP